MKNSLLILVPLLCIGMLTSCGRQAPAPADDTIAATPLLQNVTPATPVPGLEDLPECPGWLATQNARGDAREGSARLLSNQSVAQLAVFYTEQLAAAGWLLGASVKQGQERHLQFSQAGRSLRVQIGPTKESGATAAVFLAWNQSAYAAELDDSYEPDFTNEDIDEASRSSIEW